MKGNENGANSYREYEDFKNTDTKLLIKGSVLNVDRYFVKYPIAAAYNAITEHRWDDAANLLPFLYLQSESIFVDFFWASTTLLMNNVPEFSALRNEFTQDLLSFTARPFEVALEKISYEFSNLPAERMDFFIQMLDEITSKVKCWKGEDQAVFRLNAFVHGYKALASFWAWKNTICNENDADMCDAEPEAEDVTYDLMGVVEEEDIIRYAPERKKFVLKSRHLKSSVFLNFKRAAQYLIEPHEWLMGPYLEALIKVHGHQAAMEELIVYMNKYPNHLPAHYMAYNFYMREIPQSEGSQLVELKKIAEISPDDQLVMKLVETLINGVEDWKFDTDDLHEWSDVDGKTESCLSMGPKFCKAVFNSELQRKTIVRCVKMMMNMVEYQEWRWNEQPWIILCHLLRRIHLSRLKCGYCEHCRTVSSELIDLREEKSALWVRYIWIEPGYSAITAEQSEIFFYSTYTAHILKFT